MEEVTTTYILETIDSTGFLKYVTYGIEENLLFPSLVMYSGDFEYELEPKYVYGGYSDICRVIYEIEINANFEEGNYKFCMDIDKDQHGNCATFSYSLETLSDDKYFLENNNLVIPETPEVEVSFNRVEHFNGSVSLEEVTTETAFPRDSEIIMQMKTTGPMQNTESHPEIKIRFSNNNTVERTMDYICSELNSDGTTTWTYSYTVQREDVGNIMVYYNFEEEDIESIYGDKLVIKSEWEHYNLVKCEYTIYATPSIIFGSYIDMEEKFLAFVDQSVTTKNVFYAKINYKDVNEEGINLNLLHVKVNDEEIVKDFATDAENYYEISNNNIDNYIIKITSEGGEEPYDVKIELDMGFVVYDSVESNAYSVTIKYDPGETRCFNRKYYTKCDVERA